MPRYRLHIHDCEGDIDLAEVELPDMEAARKMTARVGAELLLAVPAAFWNESSIRVDLCDEYEQVIVSLAVAAVIPSSSHGAEPKRLLN